MPFQSAALSSLLQPVKLILFIREYDSDHSEEKVLADVAIGLTLSV